MWETSHYKCQESPSVSCAANLVAAATVAIIRAKLDIEVNDSITGNLALLLLPVVTAAFGSFNTMG